VVVRGLCGLRVVVPGLVFLVSWLHGSRACWLSLCPLVGGGVVGAGVCGTGLLFENYIVDASI
jgi:hypothetical protein